MTPVSTHAVTKTEKQPRLREEGSRAAEAKLEGARRDAKSGWIRPAPGEDKYTDVPCTD